MFGNNARKIN